MADLDTRRVLAAAVVVAVVAAGVLTGAAILPWLDPARYASSQGFTAASDEANETVRVTYVGGDISPLKT